MVLFKGQAGSAASSGPNGTSPPAVLGESPPAPAWEAKQHAQASGRRWRKLPGDETAHSRDRFQGRLSDSTVCGGCNRRFGCAYSGGGGATPV